MRIWMGVAACAGWLLAAGPALAQTDYLLAAGGCMGFDEKVKGEAALTACKTALADPKLSASDRSDLYVGEGYHLALAGRYDDSIASYGRALSADPETPARSMAVPRFCWCRKSRPPPSMI